MPPNFHVNRRPAQRLRCGTSYFEMNQKMALAPHVATPKITPQTHRHALRKNTKISNASKVRPATSRDTVRKNTSNFELILSPIDAPGPPRAQSTDHLPRFSEKVPKKFFCLRHESSANTRALPGHIHFSQKNWVRATLF